MFKRIKELNRKHPVATVIPIFLLLYLLSCAMLTVWLGQDVVEVSVINKSAHIRESIEQEMEAMRKNLRSSGSGTDNRLMIKDYMDSLLSNIQYYTEGEVYGYWRVESYNEGNKDNLILSSEPDVEDTVILQLFEEDGVTYLECPYHFYFSSSVRDAIEYLREQGYFVSDYFGLYLTEGYRNGNEFRPVTVKIIAIDLMGSNRSLEVEVRCTHGNDSITYEPTENDIELKNLSKETNGIILPSRNCSLELLTESEMITKCLDGYGDKAAREFTYFCYSWDAWELPDDREEYFILEPLENRFLAFDDPSEFGFNNYKVLVLKKDGTNPYSGFKVPFSDLKGNLYFGYINTLKGANGENLKVMFFGIIEKGLEKKLKDFYSSMIPLYIVLAVFFLFLAWYWSKRFYSLEGKSRFHRSLINSMAHDLKTPLMIMQGFSENLKDNIRQEKHGYYADQIVENAEYLERLINKNIEVSNKSDTDPDKKEVVHLSELVKKAESRYKERLEDKNLKIKQKGASFLEGDPEIIGILVDNLISNAIKYSFEDETIEVFGDIRYFTIKNKAELHYKKNLKHLLDPLEMGDESRTAKSGTGLGLSIANDIAHVCGWKMKILYDRKSKEFTCKVHLRKWL